MYNYLVSNNEYQVNTEMKGRKTMIILSAKFKQEKGHKRK